MEIEPLILSDSAAVDRLNSFLSDAAHYDLDEVERPTSKAPVLTALEGGEVVAAAWAIAGPEAGVMEARVVIHPEYRGPQEVTTQALLRSLGGAARERGAETMLWWVSNPDAATDRRAASLGLKRGRSLYEMRRPLPLESSLTTGLGIDTRAFVVGQDETAWLGVNNRALSWHPEQGGWDAGTIRAREQESWFSPSGFLIHETEGVMDGFCWTKVHEETEPRAGEIYVIAADPAHTAKGLGRRLVVAGLAHLSAQGLEMGLLWTESDNKAAVRLYVDLGFRVYSINQCYIGSLS